MTERFFKEDFKQAAAPAAPSVKASRRWALFGSYAALSVFVVIFLFPPYFMFITSLKSDQEIASLEGPPLFLSHWPTLNQYYRLFTESPFPRFFLNSAMVTVASVALSMTISVLAAYGLARMRFIGSGLLATGVFLTYLIPDTLLFIPLFKVVGFLGLLNNKWAMLVVFPCMSVPFCTWIMIGYFSSIPKELDEAALVDGAGYLQMLRRVFIPVALPGVIAATIFAFTVSWAGFLYPAAYLYTNEEMTLTVGTVSALIRGDVYHWGRLMGGALLAAAPPVILYAFLMDYYISGLTAGSTKG